MRTLAVALPLALALFSAGPAWAFTPPKVQGHVTDTAGKLSVADREAVNLHLEKIQKDTGNHVIAFLVGSLEGEPIEQIAYQTFNAWHVGEKGLDNGVLLVVAPNERRVRIETGKGTGGEITDVEALAIIRAHVSPHLKEDHFREAIIGGADGISAKLTGRVIPKPSAANDGSHSVWYWLAISLFGGALSTLLIYGLVRLFRLRGGGAYSADGAWNPSYGSSSYGSSSYDSSSSSSSSDSSGSSGSSGSSYGGYDGGGGSSGGGGASDSY